jgi:hypothetical protein
MKTIILTSLIALFAGASASAQVDTLELVEIGRIALPQAITKLYVQDLNGDSLKEIILADSTYAYVYDWPTRNLLWRSPQMIRPRDVQFGDLDGDGLLDIAVRDDQSLRLFDPHDSSLIWTSPSFDSTFSCYTIGDFQNDGYLDFIIVKKEVFSRRQDCDNGDTVWIDIYDGPDFSHTASAMTIMLNYSAFWGEPYPTFEYRYENPYRIIVASLSGQNGLYSKAIIFSAISEAYWNEYIGGYEKSSGNVYLVDPGNMNVGSLDNESRISSFIINEDNSTRKLCAIAEYYYYYNWTGSEGTTITKYLYGLSYDIVTIQPIWEVEEPQRANDWDGCIMGDIALFHEGPELCFAARGDLRMLAVPDAAEIWSFSGVDPSNTLFRIYRNTGLFSRPQIMYGRLDRLFDTQDGHPSAIFTDQGIELADVIDIDNDSNDEFLSIWGNTVCLYHAERYPIGIIGNDAVPTRFSLSPTYPNPFNASTTISFSLSARGEASLEIFDILGRKVAALHEGVLGAGRYTVTWDAGDLPSGIYLARLTSAGNLRTRRMALVK